MSYNLVYLGANLLALIGWIVLFVSVLTSSKLRWIADRAIPIMLALVYCVIIFPNLSFEGGGFSSLDSLSRLFAQSEIALAGWLHYLAIDLFFGGWLVSTSQQEQLPLQFTLTTLLLTALFAPVGLVFFFVVRALYRNRKTEQIKLVP